MRNKFFENIFLFSHFFKYLCKNREIYSNFKEPGTCSPLYLLLRFAPQKDAAAIRAMEIRFENKKTETQFRLLYL